MKEKTLSSFFAHRSRRSSDLRPSPPSRTQSGVITRTRRRDFRNKKHTDQWINTLEQYLFPRTGKKLLNELGPADFAVCLKPIWLEKPETASRVRQRCDAAMNWAAASGFIVASPVGVVDKLLPKQPGKRERVEHQPALPWRLLRTFFSDILQSGGPNTTRHMLELLILTACRSGELRQMQWDEIDFSRASGRSRHRE